MYLHSPITVHALCHYTHVYYNIATSYIYHKLIQYPSNERQWTSVAVTCIKVSRYVKDREVHYTCSRLLPRQSNIIVCVRVIYDMRLVVFSCIVVVAVLRFGRQGKEIENHPYDLRRCSQSQSVSSGGCRRVVCILSISIPYARVHT